jgi:drug/metabolite transporter (DMT)-like permease
VLFALMSVIWGVPYLMIKIAVEEVSAPVLVFARTAVGAAILVPLALRPGVPDVLRRHWKPLALFAVIEMLVPWLLLTDAERHLSSSMAGLLVAAVPIIAVIVGKIAGDRERLGPVRWLGLLVGLAGVALLAAPHLAGGGVWPIIEMFVVAVGYATAPLLAARKLTDVPALPMTAACLSLAALVYAPPAILTWPDALPSARSLVAIGGLAVICTALAFLVFFELIREVGPARATVFTYVNPAVAVAAGVAFLGEPLTPTIVAAFALILGGSVLATSRGSGAAPAAAGTEPPTAVDPKPA